MKNVNVIVEAMQLAKKHIVGMLNGCDDRAKREAELKKLSLEQLVDLVLSAEKFEGVKIEDMVKLVLEDARCAWLDYETIAQLVKDSVPTAKTSNKSIASYASKYPGQKGWTVIPRKSSAERNEELMKLINLG
jgi:hypothetical protein